MVVDSLEFQVNQGNIYSILSIQKVVLALKREKHLIYLKNKQHSWYPLISKSCDMLNENKYYFWKTYGKGKYTCSFNKYMLIERIFDVSRNKVCSI